MEFDKIRRHLVLKYTVIITLMLISVLCISSYMHLRTIYTAIEETLADYLNEEVREAERDLQRPHISIEPPQHINPNSNAMMSIWYYKNQITHAEILDNPALSQKLLERINNRKYKEKTIYKENINDEWSFLLMSQNIKSKNGQIGKVVVISNISKMERWLSSFFIYFATAVLLLIILSFFLGNFFAARAIRQINIILDRQKRFVSDASHELRTPLSIMLAYTELLEHKYSKKTLQKLKEEISSMAELTGKLLQFARFDNAQVPLEIEKFNLSQFLNTVCQDTSLLAQKKNISIKTDIEDNIEIGADKLQIKRLLYILLDNALKYSPENTEIQLSAKKNKTTATIRIKDHGCGIAPKDIEHIFERFYRADEARSHNAGQGLGLGLSMAWLITRLHRGKINVESTSGQGSTFTVSLPLHLKIQTFINTGK